VEPIALRLPTRGAGLLVTVPALIAACTSLAPTVPFKEPAELAGTWQGRLIGRSGHAVTSLTIKADGSFTGTMYLDGEDKDINGAITMVRPGYALYRGSQGFGSVVLQDESGKRTLRFQPDGGGVASVFTAVQ
jgi:hypothetical protein